MKKIALTAAFVLIAVMIPLGANAADITSAGRDMPSVSAKHAVIVEAETGRVIAEKSAYEKASMASTTKIMTALLLCESGELDKEIVATSEMVNVEGTSMGLLVGDRVHYRDLLYGMMLASGNDAANATAISLAGSVDKFADMMNAKAAEIGMKNTHFVTPSGLDDEEHYTTAYDMALLAVYAMKNPDFAAAAGSRSARLEYGNPPYDRTLSNHNRMLRCYEGACGVKTGFTKKSRRCLVSCAKRGGVGVIAVTLNAPDDWNDHTAMLDYGFSVLETRDLPVPDGLSATVSSGTEPSVDGIFPPTELSLLPEDFDDLTYVVSMNDKLTAPVTEGDLIGVVTYYLSGSKIMEVPVTAQSRVDVPEYVPPKKDMLYWLWRLIGCK